MSKLSLPSASAGISLGSFFEPEVNGGDVYIPLKRRALSIATMGSAAHVQWAARAVSLFLPAILTQPRRYLLQHTQRLVKAFPILRVFNIRGDFQERSPRM
jgi:hypothetical protein